MPTPIRITFLESAEHSVEAQKQVPAPTGSFIPNKVQNIFISVLVGGALGYQLIIEFRKGAKPALLLAAAIAVILILLFWMWFFKKIGLYKTENDDQWTSNQLTEKDRERLRVAYRKRTGKDEALITAEFDEGGFSLTSEGHAKSSYNWSSIKRVVESSGGLFIYIPRWIDCYFWFPKVAFASENDYRELINLIKARVRKFQKIDTQSFVALGSNLGNSPEIISQALERLQNFSRQPLLKSSLWQTTPVDCPPGSPPFVNAIVALIPFSNETPETLLQKLQLLEKEFGRQPKKILNEPRPLDLDLIAFGNEIRVSEKLTIPHPRAHERRFVLQPLSEIAPDLILPGQEKTVRQLLGELKTDEVLTRVDTVT